MNLRSYLRAEDAVKHRSGYEGLRGKCYTLGWGQAKTVRLLIEILDTRKLNSVTLKCKSGSVYKLAVAGGFPCPAKISPIQQQ